MYLAHLRSCARILGGLWIHKDDEPGLLEVSDRLSGRLCPDLTSRNDLST